MDVIERERDEQEREDVHQFLLLRQWNSYNFLDKLFQWLLKLNDIVVWAGKCPRCEWNKFNIQIAGSMEMKMRLRIFWQELLKKKRVKFLCWKRIRNHNQSMNWMAIGLTNRKSQTYLFLCLSVYSHCWSLCKFNYLDWTMTAVNQWSFLQDERQTDDEWRRKI